MRTLMKVTIPVESGNAAIQNGTLSQTMQSALESLKPEAAYFCAMDGQRCCMMVFDLAEPSRIPVIAEPFFMSLNAAIEFTPVMNADDLKKALSMVSADAKFVDGAPAMSGGGTPSARR